MKYMLLFPLLVTTFCSWSNDTITLKILDNFDQNHFTQAESVANVKTNDDIVKIWAWVKFRSETPLVKEQKYYFEWEYDDGNGTIKLDNHTNNPAVYTRQRREDRIDDYTWLVKRIWPVNKGEYIFKVKVLDPNSKKLVTLKSSSVIVE
ncbi:hypothetical protein [Vibrio owensii]|uniref:hypothetical protein n=1 Tax=Vibrio harveyi group TaxID=717610 RepID=UPI00148CB99A|nr:hypothetical protein [Vibrio owensii]MDA0384075.1 hypothetical protein [Vibrio owensii]NOI70209.1 hypothetical protein [Vibrio owensii]